MAEIDTLTFHGRFVDGDGEPIPRAQILFDNRPLAIETDDDPDFNVNFTADLTKEGHQVAILAADGKPWHFNPKTIKEQIAQYRAQRKSGDTANKTIVLGEVVFLGHPKGPIKSIPKPPVKTLDRLSAKEELEEMSIAHVDLKIPPTSFLFLQENQVDTIPVLRSDGIQLKNGGQDRTLILNLFFQGDGNGMMPPEFMRLLAIAECAPFVPIENLHLNIVMDIQAVGIMGYTLESIEGMPLGFTLQLVLKEFNFKSYLPYVTDFKEQFDMGLFSWYVDRYIEKRWGAPLSKIQAEVIQAEISDRSRLKIRYKSLTDAQRTVDQVKDRERKAHDLMRGIDHETYTCSGSLSPTDVDGFKAAFAGLVADLGGGEEGKMRAERALFQRGAKRDYGAVQKRLGGFGVSLSLKSALPNLSEGRFRDTFRDGHKGVVSHLHGDTQISHPSFLRFLTILGTLSAGPLESKLGRITLDELLDKGEARLFLVDFKADGKSETLDLTSKNNQELRPRTKESLNQKLSDVMKDPLSEEKGSEFLFKDLIVTKVRIAHENVMAVQTPNMATSSSLQFLGRMPKRISLSLRTPNIEELMNLTEVLGTLNAQLQAFHSAGGAAARGDGKGEIDPTFTLPGEALPEILSIGIVNPFLNSLGLRDVMVQRFSIASVPDSPTEFEIGLELSSFDHTQRAIEKTQGPTTQQNVGVDTYFNATEQNALLMEEELCGTETYPDLFLPTYDELLKETGVKLDRAPHAYGIKYSNDRLQPRFVDPDFYMKRHVDHRGIAAELSNIRHDSTLIAESNATEFGGELYTYLDKYQAFPEWQSKQINQALRNTIRENFQERSRMVAAFPTFYLAFRTEDEEMFWWRNFGEFYGFRGLISAELHQSRDLPADVLKLTLSNVYNNLFKISGYVDKNVLDQLAAKTEKFEALSRETSGLLPTFLGQRSFFEAARKKASELATKSERSNFGEGSRPGAAGTAAEHALTSIYLQAGARLHFRLGYGANASQLIPKFNGVITELMPGPQVQIVCQGDGIELNRTLTTNDSETGLPFLWGDSPHIILYNLLSDQIGNPLNPSAGGLINAAMSVVRDNYKRLKAEGGVPLGTVVHFGNALPWFSYANGRFESVIGMDVTSSIVGGIVIGILAGVAGKWTAGALGVKSVGTVNRLMAAAGITAVGVVGGLAVGSMTDRFLRILYDFRRACSDLYDTEIFKRTFPNCTAFDNIYSVHGTGSWMEMLGTPVGQPGKDEMRTPGTGGYIKIPLKGKTGWDIAKICEMTSPEYIAATMPIGTRSTLFFGLPFWDVTIANPSEESRLKAYDNCGYDLYAYARGSTQHIKEIGKIAQLSVGEKETIESDLRSNTETFLTQISPPGKRIEPAAMTGMVDYAQKHPKSDVLGYAFGLMYMRLNGDIKGSQSYFGITPTLAKAAGVRDFEPNQSLPLQKRIEAEMGALDRIIEYLGEPEDGNCNYSDTEICRAFVKGRPLTSGERAKGAPGFATLWYASVKPSLDAMRVLANKAATGDDKEAILAHADAVGSAYQNASTVEKVAGGLETAFEIAFWIQVVTTIVGTLGAATPAAIAEVSAKTVGGSVLKKMAMQFEGEIFIAQVRAAALSGAPRAAGKAVLDRIGNATVRNAVAWGGSRVFRLLTYFLGPTKWTRLLVNGLLLYGAPAAIKAVVGTTIASTKAAGSKSTGDKVYYKVKRPFRSIWMFDSYNHILDNQIFASSDQVYTDVVCAYGGGSTTVHADVNIYSHLRKIKEVQSPLVTAAFDSTFGPSRWYAKNALKDSMTRMYQGNVTVVGQPLIKPHDTILMHDHYTDMQGPINVRSVTHVFGPRTGLVAVVEPDLVVYTSGNNMELLHTWLWGIHTAFMLTMSAYAVGATIKWGHHKFGRVKNLGTLSRLLRMSVFKTLGSPDSALAAERAAAEGIGSSAAFSENLAKLWKTLGFTSEASLKATGVARGALQKGALTMGVIVRGAKASPKLLKLAPVRFLFAYWAIDGIFDSVKNSIYEFFEPQAVRMCPLTINGQPLQAGVAGSIGLMVNINGEMGRKDDLILGYRNLDMILRLATVMIHQAVPFYASDKDLNDQLARLNEDRESAATERRKRLQDMASANPAVAQEIQDNKDLRAAAAKKSGSVKPLIQGVPFNEANIQKIKSLSVSYMKQENVVKVKFDGLKNVQMPLDGKFIQSDVAANINIDSGQIENTFWVRLLVGKDVLTISHIKSFDKKWVAAMRNGTSVPPGTILGQAEGYAIVALEQNGKYLDPIPALHESSDVAPRGKESGADNPVDQRF